MLPNESRPIWELANYVKHKDEWPPVVIDTNSCRTLDALVQLGVAATGPAGTEFVRWVVQTAVRKISGEQALSAAIASIAANAEGYALAMEARVQQDFAPFDTQLDAVRAFNAPHKRIRATKKPEEKEVDPILRTTEGGV